MDRTGVCRSATTMRANSHRCAPHNQPPHPAGVLGGIEESLVALVPIKTKNNPAYTSAAIRRSMLEVTNVIMQWLGAGSSEEGRDDDAMFDAVAQIANK